MRLKVRTVQIRELSECEAALLCLVITRNTRLRKSTVTVVTDATQHYCKQHWMYQQLIQRRQTAATKWQAAVRTNNYNRN